MYGWANGIRRFTILAWHGKLFFGSRSAVGTARFGCNGRDAMRYLFSVLTVLGTLAVATASVQATEVTRTFTKGSYNYTCIMKGEIEYCGNWNVFK